MCWVKYVFLLNVAPGAQTNLWDSAIVKNIQMENLINVLEETRVHVYCVKTVINGIWIMPSVSVVKWKLNDFQGPPKERQPQLVGCYNWGNTVFIHLVFLKQDVPWWASHVSWHGFLKILNHTCVDCTCNMEFRNISSLKYIPLHLFNSKRKPLKENNE